MPRRGGEEDAIELHKAWNICGERVVGLLREGSLVADQ